MSNSLRSHGLWHARPPCPSSTPGVYSNSCPSSRWCHPTISSSVILFSSRLQSFPASGTFQMSQLFASGGQSIGISASASVLPMNILDWFPLGWNGWDLLAVQGTLKSLLQHHSSKASILQRSTFFMVQLSHPYMTPGKTTALTRWTFDGTVWTLIVRVQIPAHSFQVRLHKVPKLLNLYSGNYGNYDIKGGLKLRHLEFNHSKPTSSLGCLKPAPEV